MSFPSDRLYRYYVACRNTDEKPEADRASLPQKPSVDTGVAKPAAAPAVAPVAVPAAAAPANVPAEQGSSKTATLKAEGNEFFKAKQWEDAIRMYTEAIEANDDQSVVAQCYCNRAAGYMQTSQFSEALDDCTAALAIDADYFRALKRRADAREAMGDLKGCIRDLFTAINACDATAVKGTGNRGGKKQHQTTMQDFDRALVVLGQIEAQEELDRRAFVLSGPFQISPFLSFSGCFQIVDLRPVPRLTGLCPCAPYCVRGPDDAIGVLDRDLSSRIREHPQY